jgi:hypothetical protein
MLSKVIALTSAALPGLWLRDSGYIGAAQSNFWFAVFIATFLICPAYMCLKFIPKSAFFSTPPVQRNREATTFSPSDNDDYAEIGLDDEIGEGRDHTNLRCVRRRRRSWAQPTRCFLNLSRGSP